MVQLMNALILSTFWLWTKKTDFKSISFFRGIHKAFDDKQKCGSLKKEKLNYFVSKSKLE